VNLNHRATGTAENEDGKTRGDLAHPGRDRRGFDDDGWDLRGFDSDGLNSVTGTLFDPDGFDFEGVDKDGFDKNGFYSDMASDPGGGRSPSYQYGWHRDTRAEFDTHGFDHSGWSKLGGDSTGGTWKRKLW